MQTIRRYDHRAHAGNAGDVWKHFVLAEAASFLLSNQGGLTYAESHVGRAEYLLEGPGEWTGGVGRCWMHLPALQNFCYFRVLAGINSHGLICYPGSALLVYEISRIHGSKLNANVWDIDPEVVAGWITLQDLSDIKFHLGDGFVGVLSLLNRSPPGLLLVDPPYVDPDDMRLAEDLLCRAIEKGWAVLWWYMAGEDTTPRGTALEATQGADQEAAQQVAQGCSLEKFSLKFTDAGMDCGRWKGATVALACSDDLLAEHIKGQVAALKKILQSN